jgi:hypothetical protein
MMVNSMRPRHSANASPRAILGILAALTTLLSGCARLGYGEASDGPTAVFRDRGAHDFSHVASPDVAGDNARDGTNGISPDNARGDLARRDGEARDGATLSSSDGGGPDGAATDAPTREAGATDTDGSSGSYTCGTYPKTLCLMGCCEGSVCVPLSSQTAARCGLRRPCSPCADGQSCVGGSCVCDSAACAGCCDNNACQPGNTTSLCGTLGEPCDKCTGQQRCITGACT